MVSITTLEQVEAQVAGLRDLVGGLAPDAVPSSEVSPLWAAFDTIERLGSAAKTLLAPRLEETGEWKDQGHPSAAHHMAALAGSSVRAAQTRMATAKRLEDLAATTAALRAGTISEPQARLIADAGSVDPGVESELLGVAQRASLAELGEACGRAKAAADPDPDATYKRICQNRRLRQFRDTEGGWNLVARGPVDAGARFNLALEEIVDDLFRQARSRGERVDREQLAFDALIELVRHKSPGTTKDLSARLVGLIRVDHTALVRGRIEGDETCEIAGLGPIPVARARELLGDAALKLILTKGNAVANVTHLGRKPTAAQRAALLWSQPECTVLGCTRRIVQYDHRCDWSLMRHTVLHELDRLCPHHHALKTHEAWALVPGTGKRPMVPPHDPHHPDNQPRKEHTGTDPPRHKRHPRPHQLRQTQQPHQPHPTHQPTPSPSRQITQRPRP